MAGLGTVGSGLDPTTTAKQLVAAERAVADSRLAKTETRIKAEVSAVASLRSAMSALQSALRTLATPASSQPRTVGLSTTGSFTASAASGAPTGQYQIEVKQLASAQKLASAGYVGGQSSEVGTGTLSISAGTHQFDIEIVDGKTTLADIRDAINAKAGGKGVQASLVNGDGGTRLVLTALDSGTANAIGVTTSGGDGGLATLVNGNGTQSGITELVAPRNATVVVDGIERTSASNTITDLLPGISFNLTEAKPGTTVQMHVGIDTAAQMAAVETFVEKYNAALSTTASLTAYNAATQTAAVLNGDSMVRGLTRQLRDMVGGDVTMLKNMGIEIAKDGKLALNEADFTAAVAKDPAVVGKAFGGGDSTLGTRLNSTMTALLAPDGPLKTRDDSLTQRTKTLTQQRDTLDRRMSLAEARYKAQFVALDAMVAKLQSTSNFLTQQLSSSTSAS